MEKHKDEACDYYEIHEDSMEIINKTMPEETELEDLADLFKIFGDSTRIRILFVSKIIIFLIVFSSSFSPKNIAAAKPRTGIRIMGI